MGNLPKMAAALCAYRGQMKNCLRGSLQGNAWLSQVLSICCRHSAMFWPAMLFGEGCIGCFPPADLRSTACAPGSGICRPIGALEAYKADLGGKNNAHRGRRMRWASFEVIDDWEEECRQSIGAHWEEECAAPNSVSG